MNVKNDDCEKWLNCEIKKVCEKIKDCEKLSVYEKSNDCEKRSDCVKKLVFEQKDDGENLLDSVYKIEYENVSENVNLSENENILDREFFVIIGNAGKLSANEKFSFIYIGQLFPIVFLKCSSLSEVKNIELLKFVSIFSVK